MLSLLSFLGLLPVATLSSLKWACCHFYTYGHRGRWSYLVMISWDHRPGLTSIAQPQLECFICTLIIACCWFLAVDVSADDVLAADEDCEFTKKRLGRNYTPSLEQPNGKILRPHMRVHSLPDCDFHTCKVMRLMFVPLARSPEPPMFALIGIVSTTHNKEVLPVYMW